MLATRLWMGSVLIALTVGMLVLDPYLAPVYPFLLLFQVGLSLVACAEMIILLGPGRRPQILTSVVGVVALALCNWLVHWIAGPTASAWPTLLACFTGLVLASFLIEMVTFVEPGRSMERLALTWLILVYLGVLPSYFTQIRWLYARSDDSVPLLDSASAGSVALALAIFVPKCGDIGAYCVGRLLGRHAMTPILSPKKTWEGAIGGLTGAVLVTMAIDRLAPVAVLGAHAGWEIAFGLSVGIAGMLGDLAESLIKRDCRKKDASVIVPGFGGVLDVIDAIVLAAPLTYLWFYLVMP